MSRPQIQVFPVQQNFVPNMGNFNIDDMKKGDASNEDLMAQMVTLKSVKDFLTNKIRTLEEIIKSHQKEISQLKNQLNQEMILNEKGMKKILALENRVRAYEVDKEDHDEEIKNLNLQYQKLLTEKEGDIRLLSDENSRLRDEREKMGNELINVREENERLKQTNQTYHFALTKMKSAFASNQLFNQVTHASEKKNLTPSKTLEAQ